MRILLSISSLSVGGAQTFLIRLATELAKTNFVYIYNYELNGLESIDSLLFTVPSSIRVLKLPFFLDSFGKKINSLVHRLGLSFNVWLWIKKVHFKFLILQYNIEIINSHLYHSDLFVSSCLNKSKLPFIITDHGDYRYVLNHNIADSQKLKKILNRVDKIVCISDDNINLMSKLTNTKEKCIKIYNGIFLTTKKKSKQARKELKISEKSFVFGMVARGIPEKGWKEAIQAFKCLSSTNLYLILVGSSEYLDKLKNEFKADKNIYFVGYTSNPFYWINAFDVGLLPTYFYGESLPNSIMEYLILGKPTISTEIGGIPEMLHFQNRQSGLTIKINCSNKIDIIELQKAMKLYIENSSLLKEHSKNALLNSKRFDISLCASNYNFLFNELVSQLI